MRGMDILIAVLIAALLTGASVWFYASAKQSQRLLKANDLAAQEKSALTAELAATKANLAAQTQQQEQAKAWFENNASAARQQNTEQQQENILLAAELTKTKASLAAAEANIAAQVQQQEQMKVWFENNANTVLQKTSEQLQVKSQQGLDAILSPVKDRLTDFQKKVEEVYGNEARERIGLAKQVEMAMQMSQQTSEAATSLTNALKGDAKKRGNWGEVTLENILRDSGLSEFDYITQGRDLGLTDDDGRRQMPDVIIRMPQGKHIIIDSKVTLNSYLELCAASEETEASMRAQYIAAVKRHIDDLSAKKYQDNEKLLAHDFVLMFIPVESALALALDNDAGLQAYAWKKRIALVGPNSLMMTLHTLQSIWQGEKLERNANEIAREAAGLYDKLRLVVESLNAVGRNIEQTRTAYDKAIGQLATGSGNVLKRVESFRKRGISTEKPIGQLDYAPRESEDVTE